MKVVKIKFKNDSDMYWGRVVQVSVSINLSTLKWKQTHPPSPSPSVSMWFLFLFSSELQLPATQDLSVTLFIDLVYNGGTKADGNGAGLPA